MVTFDPAEHASQRRSTRVPQAVILRVTGIDGNGEPFVEQTGTMEVSLQGCRYFSKFAVAIGSWLTLEMISSEAENLPAQRPRARVAWVRKSKHLRLFQVGVEFETPGNIWGLANPPEDWRQPGAANHPSVATFEREMKELLALAETGTYYQLLRTSAEAPVGEIQHKYREFARKFHPDLHMDHAEWTEPLHKLMEALTLAYKTLTDQTLRKQYDEQLAGSGAFTLGRHPDDQRQTAEECLEKSRECLRAQNRGGAILWLRKAVEREPTSAKYHALLARNLAAVMTLRREAVDHFEKALEIDPWNTSVCFQLAALYEGMKLPWRALPHYQTILKIDPDNSRAQERLRLLEGELRPKGTSKRTLLDRILRHSPK